MTSECLVVSIRFKFESTGTIIGGRIHGSLVISPVRPHLVIKSTCLQVKSEVNHHLNLNTSVTYVQCTDYICFQWFTIYELIFANKRKQWRSLPLNMGIPEPRRRKKHMSPLRIIPILLDYPFKYIHVSTICVTSHSRHITISRWLQAILGLRQQSHCNPYVSTIVVAYHPFSTQFPGVGDPSRIRFSTVHLSPDGSFVSCVILRCSVQKRVVRSEKTTRNPKRNGMQSSNLRGVAFPAK